MDGRQLSTKFKPKPFKRNPSSFVWLSKKIGLKTFFHSDETLTKLYLIVSHYCICVISIEKAGISDNLGIFLSIHLKKSLNSQLYLVASVPFNRDGLNGGTWARWLCALWANQ